MRNRSVALLVTAVALAVTSVAGAQNFPSSMVRSAPAPAAPDAFQVRYMSNLGTPGDSLINITNAGSLSGAEPAGNICVNTYVFSPDEELDACCSCLVTPNGLVSLSANADLTSNTLTGARPTSIVVKLLATAAKGTSCSHSAENATAANLAPGMRAWATTLHALPGSTSFTVTETEFSPAALSSSELSRLTSLCGFINANGSGFGICRSCRAGGL